MLPADVVFQLLRQTLQDVTDVNTGVHNTSKLLPTHIPDEIRMETEKVGVTLRK